MIGIDTNVLIRYLVRDDETQFDKVSRLIEREIATGQRVMVNLLVLMETEWALRSRYRLAKARMLDLIAGLINANDIQLENEAVVVEALHAWKNSTAGFADCLIGAVNRRLECDVTVSFDAKAARLPGFAAA